MTGFIAAHHSPGSRMVKTLASKRWIALVLGLRLGALVLLAEFEGLVGGVLWRFSRLSFKISRRAIAMMMEIITFCRKSQ